MGELKAWARAALVRALKTAAQTAVAMLPAAACITEVDWPWVLGTAALAGVASALTSVAGLPEAGGASVAELAAAEEAEG